MGCRQSRAAMIADPLFFADDRMGGGGGGGSGVGDSLSTTTPIGQHHHHHHHQPQIIVRSTHHQHLHHAAALGAATTNHTGTTLHHHHHHALPSSASTVVSNETTPSNITFNSTATVPSTSAVTGSTTTTTATRNLRRRRRLYEAQLREDARAAEIVALQQSLAAMEDFFQSLLGQSHLFQEAMDPTGSWNAGGLGGLGGGAGNNGPPPASQEFLQKSLPALVVASCKHGTLCGVCGEEIVQTASNSTTIKLPCGHIFHQASCIQPWLERHCTCPVCRYELETDDASYETGRIERMSMRQLPVQEEEDDVDEGDDEATTRTGQRQQQRHQQDGDDKAKATTQRDCSDDDDDDEEEHDDDILDDAIPSFATPTNMNIFTTDVYDADESGTEEASLRPSSSGTFLPKSPHRNHGASHYDADESSLETVDFGVATTTATATTTTSFRGASLAAAAAAASATGNISTDDSA